MTEELKQVIADTKLVNLFAMAWSEGQFFGHMGKNSDGSIYRESCNCRFCGQHGILLEASASHAKVCTEPGPKMMPSFSEGIERRFPGKKYRI